MCDQFRLDLPREDGLVLSSYDVGRFRASSEHSAAAQSFELESPPPNNKLLRGDCGDMLHAELHLDVDRWGFALATQP